MARERIKSIVFDFENKTFSFDFGDHQLNYRIEQIPEEVAEQVEAEAKKTVTLTGKIKGEVRQGRVDSSGKPTAWARVAAHIEGEEQAKMLSTTFHRHAAGIALGLPAESQITFSGYLRPSQDPSRMDSVSAFHLIDYPGKPTKE